MDATCQRSPVKSTFPGVGRSLGLPRPLVPHIDEVFANLRSLGGYPAIVLAMARSVAPDTASILELACGKGDLATRLARIAPVVGVDGHAAFIDAARQLAITRNVGERCTFQVGDVRRFPRGKPADLACMIGLFPAANAARVLRRLVRPGGHYLVDDAVRVRSQAGLEHVPTRTAVSRSIRDLGDQVIMQRTITVSEVLAQSRLIRRATRQNLRRLVESSAKLERAAASFIESQDESTAMLTGPLRPVIWLVKRGD